MLRKARRANCHYVDVEHTESQLQSRYFLTSVHWYTPFLSLAFPHSPQFAFAAVRDFLRLVDIPSATPPTALMSLSMMMSLHLLTLRLSSRRIAMLDISGSPASTRMNLRRVPMRPCFVLLDSLQLSLAVSRIGGDVAGAAVSVRVDLGGGARGGIGGGAVGVFGTRTGAIDVPVPAAAGAYLETGWIGESFRIRVAEWRRTGASGS
jgi:hypothetical protein